MQNIRVERANNEILRALANIFTEKVNDPRLDKVFLTFTYAKTTPDFRYCKVGFSILNGDKNEVKKILKGMSGFVRKEIMNLVRLPFSPSFEFVADVGSDNSERINDILRNLEIPEETEESEGDYED